MWWNYAAFHDSFFEICNFEACMLLSEGRLLRGGVDISHTGGVGSAEILKQLSRSKVKVKRQMKDRTCSWNRDTFNEAYYILCCIGCGFFKK